MKLLCVKQPDGIVRSGVNDSAMIYVGNKYTLDYEYRYEGRVYYRLTEIAGAAFHESYFAPIDTDLDETTLVNEEWEEKYCVPVNK